MLVATTNNPNTPGALASPKRTFGTVNRYAVAAVHTRFDAVQWFVWDADVPDDVTGLPSVIRQAATEAEAVAGLEGPDDADEMCCRYCGKDMGNDPSDPPCPCSGETWGHCAISRGEFEEEEEAQKRVIVEEEGDNPEAHDDER